MHFAPLYPVLHWILKPLFPDCLWEGFGNSKTIALTFDDGPHPQHTLPLLEVLARYQITANFFWLGVCVNRNPTIAREIYQQGHWVGLHGYDHRIFPTLAVDELKDQLEKTQLAIARACDLDLSYVQQHIRDVRPPVGVFTPQTLIYLQQWHYRPVMWSVVPEDWVRPGVAIATQRVLEQTQNGSLIVLHDGYHGGEDVAAIASTVIPTLLDLGYEFVTIDQLWQQRQLTEASKNI
ncbi:MAG: polysaccharide deacetylase family protein [Oculatellaceae cyanobacterium bins.114]|nr:polysaccharide deacetylase family protein [Oculatellaceae cyanobacterium bins.114]